MAGFEVTIEGQSEQAFVMYAKDREGIDLIEELLA
jgi:hypothetical protein